MKEIKDLFDIPVTEKELINKWSDGLILDIVSATDLMKSLEKVRSHTVFGERRHIPQLVIPTDIDHNAYFTIDSLADLEYPLFIPNTPLNTKAFTPLITLPEDLDGYKFKHETTSKQNSDKRNSAKKRDKVKVKAQKKARRMNRK